MYKFNPKLSTLKNDFLMCLYTVKYIIIVTLLYSAIMLYYIPSKFQMSRHGNFSSTLNLPVLHGTVLSEVNIFKHY